MTTPAVSPPRWEVIQHHPASCRVNLLAWGLLAAEAKRILAELQDAQRARQGGIIVAGKIEHGWVYSVRSVASSGVARSGLAGLGEVWHGEAGQGMGLAGAGEQPAPAVITPPARARRRRTTRGHG